MNNKVNCEFCELVNKMPGKRIKIEYEDPETDDKITITIEGSLKNARKIIETIIGDQEDSIEIPEKVKTIDIDSMTTKDKLTYVIVSTLKNGWFTSQDISDFYKEYFDSEISMSTISTYLNRLWEKGNGILDRSGNRTGYKYRLKTESKKVQKLMKKFESLEIQLQNK